MAVYACVGFIAKPNDFMNPIINPEYWCVEEALYSQEKSFIEKMELITKKHEIGTLISNALGMIVLKHGEAIYAASIADKLNVSEAHLSRQFKKTLGVGITQCIRYVRMYLAAIDMLKEDMSIKKVAEKEEKPAKATTKTAKEEKPAKTAKETK